MRRHDSDMIKIRKSEERGKANHGWLDTRHTFSFANYYDPEHMGFRSLRVINEDKVKPGKGFGTHPHENMEIITYVIDGAIEHKDSTGTASAIRPGEIQRMSAGTGVMHSEYNPSKKDTLHLLQIWIEPGEMDIEPGYEQKKIGQETGKLILIASQKPDKGSVKIHQDASVYAAYLNKGDVVVHRMKPKRHAWIQVVKGAVKINDKVLESGDGAAISDESKIEIKSVKESEILLFDLK